MFVQRLVRLDRLSEVHVQAVVKLQLEVRDASLTTTDVLLLFLCFLLACSQPAVGIVLLFHLSMIGEACSMICSHGIFHHCWSTR